MLNELELTPKIIEENIDAILLQSSEDGVALWEKINQIHPAELALILNDTADNCVLEILQKMTTYDCFEVFEKLSEQLQAQLISKFNNERLTFLFKNIPADDLTTIFENVSHKDLEKYLKLTNKTRRQKIISSLKSDEKSAGRILNSDIFFLHQELTIKKVVSLLQMQEKRVEFLPRIYVVSADLKLEGFIEISDLLKNKPDKKIAEIFTPIDIKVFEDDDQEKVANLLKHYHLLSVPVTDENNIFLGVITANDVLDVIEEEVTEDSYKMSGVANIEHAYVSAGFWTIVSERCKWLAPLLIFQSISSIVVNSFGDALTTFGLFGYATMLIGTGGNVGNQSATLFVRGLATGEINRKNKRYVFIREIFISMAIGFVLASLAVFRIYFALNHLPSLAAVISSLFLIVITSAFLGTAIPMALDYYKIDPANSAAPFISTLMDILGVTIYCIIAKLLLG